MNRTRATRQMLALALILAATAASAGETSGLDPGLVTAMDRIGGNLLGSDAFDAVLQDPVDPDQPEGLRLYLSPAQSHPVEVVFVLAPEYTVDPPLPAHAAFRLTLGPEGGLKLEHDPSAGDIIPCIVPGDVTAIAAAPADSGRGTPDVNAGLVTALDRVGKNLLGAAAFEAVLTDSPEPITPAPLRVFLAWEQASPVEIVLQAPGEPAFLRVHVGPAGGEHEANHLVIEHDSERSSRVIPVVETADLSGVAPPQPDAQCPADATR